MEWQTRIPSLAEVFARDVGHTFEANDLTSQDVQRRRDELLVQKNSAQYCADRCLNAGYCDVLEDFFTMTTAQVRRFCEKCHSNDECELPEAVLFA